MKKIFLNALFFLYFIPNFLSQPYFQKSYSNVKSNYTNSCKQMINGDIVCAGLSSGLQDGLLMKVDSNAVFKWIKYYQGTAKDEIHSINETFDGGYILGGITSSFGSGMGDMFLIKTNSNGDTIWSRTYGGTNDEIVGNSVHQTSDSGYVIVGMTKSYSAGDYDVYLVKANSKGAIQWSKSYGGIYQDRGIFLLPTSDGGFLITGTYGGTTFSARTFLIKTNALGDTLWTKRYGTTANEGTYPVCSERTSDGGFIVGGYTTTYGAGNWDIFILKTDSLGSLKWAKTYGNTSEESLSGIRQTADGGYILVGIITPSSSASGYILKTDSTGLLKWSKKVGSGGGNYLTTASTLNLFDYILSGKTMSNKIWLLKTDSSFKIGCNEFPYNTISTTPNIQMLSNPGVVVGSGCIVREAPFTISTLTTVTDTICYCNKVPKATFTYIVNQLTVNFGANDKQATSWLWDFGDGTNSTISNPAHTYTANGTYTVCLAVQNVCGTDTFCSVITLGCSLPVPTASFIYSDSLLKANFSNSSLNATNYNWDFGDGVTSNLQSPSHSYAIVGTYLVCLISSNSCHADTLCSTITVTCPPPIPNFSWLNNNNQLLTVFKDSSIGASSWLWNFGDGNTSTLQNPIHTYLDTGIYKVCMIASNGCSMDTFCTSIAIFRNILTFTTTIKDGIFYEGQTIIRTKDNGYLIGGMGENFTDAGILKIDSLGKKVWFKTYGGPLTDGIYSLAETNDGGFIVCGIKQTPLTAWDDGFIFKIDSAGNLQWDKAFGGPLSDHLYSVIQTNDGGFLATGVYSYLSTVNILLVKLTSNGSVQWTKDVGYASGGITYVMKDVIQTQNGAFIVAGYAVDPISNDRNMLLVKLDGGGNILWAKTYGGIYRDEVRAATQTTDGGFLLTGYSESFNTVGEMLFVKIDSTGNVQWSKRYWNNSQKFYSYSVIQTEDDGYCISGQDGLLKIDSLGNKKWFETYNNKYLIFDLIQTQDKGLLITGRELTGNPDRLLLAKTDELGEVGCLSSLLSLNSSSVSVTMSNAPLVVSNISILINSPLIMAAPNITDTSFCAPCGTVTPSFTHAITSSIVNFTDNSFNVSNWYWDFGDGSNSTLENPSHIYSGIGTYTVCLTASNACNKSSVCKTATILMVSNQQPTKIENIIVQVTPNPSNGVFTLQCSSDLYSIEIVNTLGEKIYKSYTSNQKTEFDISKEPIGIYFLRLTNSNGRSEVKKIIRE